MSLTPKIIFRPIVPKPFIHLGWLELAEIFEAVGGRVIISRQSGYAFYRPGLIALARVFVDLPLIAFQATIWSIIFYFMAQLHRSASAFFIYYLFVILQAVTLSAFFKAVAALSPNFDTAIRFSVLALGIAIIYVGYGKLMFWKMLCCCALAYTCMKSSLAPT